MDSRWVRDSLIEVALLVLGNQSLHCYRDGGGAVPAIRPHRARARVSRGNTHH